MKSYVFFTMNDFQIDDGGTVRMRGIVNGLAANGHIVHFISNANNTEGFHPDIRHISLNYYMNKSKRRKFQLLLILFPPRWLILHYRELIQHFQLAIQQCIGEYMKPIFFEYIDNSIGYFMKQVGIIDCYINDIHGIAPIEFQYKKSTCISEFVTAKTKFLLSKMLDKKVFRLASGLIFLSQAMRTYFINLYPELSNTKYSIIPDGVSSAMCAQNVDPVLLIKLKQLYSIVDNDECKTLLFAGSLKEMSGILDLIDAFWQVHKKGYNARLLIIGDGEEMEKAKNQITKYELQEIVYFVGRISYAKLRTFQELADIIICPDKAHPLSEMVVHIKYFDSLSSGKIVINGSFEAVNEINSKQKLSLLFEPSNVESLSTAICNVIENFNALKKEFANTSKIVCEKYTYEKMVHALTIY